MRCTGAWYGWYSRREPNHYTKLSVNASACLHCGHCEKRCPFSVKQEERMERIAKYFCK
ncbi:MAG: hypothetical protein E7613_09145 [Ruminococcaceae bacterium]|nr:hypothetical protein [Oscillospiraceae bacterium]